MTDDPPRTIFFDDTPEDQKNKLVWQRDKYGKETLVLQHPPIKPPDMRNVVPFVRPAKKPRFVVPIGNGQFSVLEGVKINDKPLSHEQAVAMARPDRPL
jgi:hypothetical protein